MFDTMTNRIVSMAAAVMMCMSNVTSLNAVSDKSGIHFIENTTTDFSEEYQDDSDLTHQSFELYPNGEDSEQLVTLDGMMPEGAEADAIDVSAAYDGVAAYDITIMDGRDEYQPGEEQPIYVEITDPAITRKKDIELWHIRDDGEREQIVDFTVKKGTLSFYATGFSVYEIVKKDLSQSANHYAVIDVESDPSAGKLTLEPVGEQDGFSYSVVNKNYPELIKKITSIAELEAYDLTETGFYLSGAISNETNNGISKFATNSITDEDRSGIVVSAEVKDKNGNNAKSENVNTHQLMYEAVTNNAAVPFYFESTGTDGQYYIYCSPDGGTTKNYIRNKQNQNDALAFAAGKSTATAYIIESGSEPGSVKIRTANQISNKYWYWNYRNKESGIARFAATDGLKYAGVGNNNIFIWYSAPSFEIKEDPYGLNGETYGLVNYQSATAGNALIADKYNDTALSKLAVTRNVDDETNAVSYTSQSGLSGWQFEWVYGTDTYKVSAISTDGASRKYLKLDSTGLTLVTDAADASALTVIPNTNDINSNYGRIRLSIPSANLAVSRSSDGKSFSKDTDIVNNSARYFDLVDLSTITDDELGLDGKTYGLINHQQNAATGNAMMAFVNGTKLNSQQLTAGTNGAGETEYSFLGYVSSWTFDNIDSNRYTIQADNGKYLKLVNGSLSLSDDPYILTVVAGTEDNAGKIRIYNATDNKWIRFNSGFQADSESNAAYFDLAVIPNAPTSDPLGLNGNTYGIVGTNNNKYYAMQTEKSSSSQLVGTQLTYEDATSFSLASGFIAGWTFEWIDWTNYRIKASNGKYLKIIKDANSGNNTNTVTLVNDPNDASVVTVELGTGANEGKILIGDSSEGRKLACWSTFSCNTDGTWLQLVSLSEQKDDPYGLDGASYGLMDYTINSSSGYALTANTDNNSFAQLYQLSTRKKSDATDTRVVYVPATSDATMWTFESAGQDKYYLKATVKGATKYLASDGTSLSLADSAAAGTAFKVIPNNDTNKTIKLVDPEGNYIYRSGESFVLSSTTPTALTFLKTTTLTEDEQIVYSAERISVSDGQKAYNGQKLIVYTRIWDEDDKKYYFYAINHDGTLYPCYPSGDKLMWMGDTMNTLLWDLTVYQYDDGSEKGYYELQNVYSKQYIKPRLTNGQLFSDTATGTDGIELPKRRFEYNESTGTYSYGEYFSDIMAWDANSFEFAALDAVVEKDPNDPKDRDKWNTYLQVVPYTQADDFYFAILDSVVQTTGELHPVETINNEDYGIKIRMKDFNVQSGYTDGNSDASEITQTYFGGDHGNTKGLLSTVLDADGHATVASTGAHFGAAFEDGIYANHLFIDSIHESSGYFEYDSCQNFATLVPGGNGLVQQTDKAGNPLYYDKEWKLTTDATYIDADSGDTVNNIPVYDFTVYTELGTMEKSGSTRSHGQFLPYNYIQPNSYSSANPKNKFDVLSVYGNNVIGELDDEDPRKYEKLYTVNVKDSNNQTVSTDYYLGMELDAKFVQTPSGLDAWGHDVIFEFTGDDDFWLFVDDELVLDLGGIHSAESGKINFRTGKVEITTYKAVGNELVKTTTTKTLRQIFIENYKKRGMTQAEAEAKADTIFEDNEETGANHGYVFTDYTEHKMKVYYMERGAGASNLHMRFNLSSVTPGNVLFSKKMTGTEHADIDYSMIQFPFKIQYQLPNDDPDNEDDWRDLENVLSPTDATPTVSYQNSTQTVRYLPDYTPPNTTKTYYYVFFLIPNKPIEINFPDEAMRYRIIECAVDQSIYNVTSSSGAESVALDDLPLGVVATGDLHDLRTKAAEVSMQPTIAFDNAINPDFIRSLNIKKELYDGKDKNTANKLTEEQDDTTFTYRLYLSSGTDDILELVNRCKYYVLDPNMNVCKWSSERLRFEACDPTVTLAQLEAMPDSQRDSYSYRSSPNGTIANIPAGYTVRVPGLPAGTRFLVEERDYEMPVGYDLMGYECQTGSTQGTQINGSYTPIQEYKIKSNGKIDSYTIPDGDKRINSAGIIVAGYQAEVIVANYKGYGLKAEKEWTDQDFVDKHDTVYTAVYHWKDTNGNSTQDTGEEWILVDNTFRSIVNPYTTVQYFFDDLHGIPLNNYKIFEVSLINPVYDEQHNLTAYDDFTRIVDGGQITLSVTEKGSTIPITDKYSVSYLAASDEEAQSLLADGIARKDIIRNSRQGGIVINLHKWNNTEPEDEALPGGTFELRSGDTTVGMFVSDETGRVTVLYGFEEGQEYTLTETKSPTGYIAMPNPITFTIIKSGSGENARYGITLSNDNDTDSDTNHTVIDATHPNADGKYWVEYDTATDAGISALIDPFAAQIDIYNKPYSLQVIKVQSGSEAKLPGATFQLYRAVESYGSLVKDYHPIAGYESLVTGDDGVIPKIDNTLIPRKYYLTEYAAPDGYEGLSDDLIITITDTGDIAIDSDSDTGFLTKVDSPDLSSVIYTINVPNKLGTHDYYFDIEKISFCDKNIHGNDIDAEQKFIFKVERFAENDPTYNAAIEAFFVTMNCPTAYQGNFSNFNLGESGKYELIGTSASDCYVKVTYNSEQYTFPAAVYSGKQTIKVSQPGLYRVTEMREWSSTDYDFWDKSNVYYGFTGGGSSSGDSVIINVSDKNADYAKGSDKTDRPTASFTNSETEYAYLSSQAYADNKINRP